MINKVKGGYKVYSKSGKPLSKTYATKSQAQRRLNQIEYFKSKKLTNQNSGFFYCNE